MQSSTTRMDGSDMSRMFFAHLTIAELKSESAAAEFEMNRQAIHPVVFNNAKQWKAMADSELARRRFNHKQYAIAN